MMENIEADYIYDRFYYKLLRQLALHEFLNVRHCGAQSEANGSIKKKTEFHISEPEAALIFRDRLSENIGASRSAKRRVRRSYQNIL